MKEAEKIGLESNADIVRVYTDNKELNFVKSVKQEDMSEEVMKKLQTLMLIREEMEKIATQKSEKQIEKSAEAINASLENYSEMEVEQFAQCIAGKRATLPGTDVVFMFQEKKNKISKKS